MRKRAYLIQAVSGRVEKSPPANSMPQPPNAPPRPRAHVKSIDGKIELTPSLSVGTAEPESIYEARYSATLQAAPAEGNGNTTNGESEIELPLPPQLISLADLKVTVDGQPSEA